MAASSWSASLYPVEEKILIPLSRYGLCEAEIITPAEKPAVRARKAMPGVGMIPAAMHSAPPRLAPEAIDRSIQSPDSRVSRPMRMRGALSDRASVAASVLASADPTRVTVGGSRGKTPAVPRMPSVPKSLFTGLPVTVQSSR
jgi:hypothetical protein